LTVLLSVSACAPRAARVDVGVIFGGDWTLGPIALTGDEVARIKARSFETLRRAFAGFDVDFDERADRDRIIRLDRNLMRVGATPIGSKESVVSLDGVHLTLLSVTRCRDIASCETYSRAELVDALGRGIGATAAHELGHQAGFRFSRDSRCDACYDGASARSREHFFGEKHWSDAARAAMSRVLAPRPAPPI
jgi:hypothetical protein